MAKDTDGSTEEFLYLLKKLKCTTQLSNQLEELRNQLEL